MLVLSNPEIEQVLDMAAVMDAIEQAYRDLGASLATNVPRVDSLVEHPTRQDAVHAFKTMSASYPRAGIAALRLNSDIVAWPAASDGGRRRKKLPVAGDPGRYNGSIQLYSTETGEPLAMFPDGVVQRTRVGATNGLALRHLARSDARTLALLGSGWQAGAQLLAADVALSIDTIRVFSPSQENRERFTATHQGRVEAEIVPVADPVTAVDGADVIMLATNSLQPVFDPAWIAPGLTVTSIRGPELPRPTLQRFDRVLVHQRETVRAYATTEATARSPEFQDGEYGVKDAESFDLTALPTLVDLLRDPALGRRDDRESIAFHNFAGFGLQFAAVGSVVLEAARAAGLGREIPTEWFLQDVHP